MFEHVPTASPDPIFALMHRYNQDARPDKVNLTVGVFQNENGDTPVLNCVKVAERYLVEHERSKNYLGIAGLESFNQLTCELVLGKHNSAIESGRAMTQQTPGGTGALRLAADFIVDQTEDRTIWCTDPTWPNHLAIFMAAKARVQTLQYLNAEQTSLDFDTYLERLSQVPRGNAVLFHTCCHNPTGFDPDREQWEQILGVVSEHGLLPMFDFAYQGFHISTDEDAWPVRYAVDLGCTVLICSSYSKNMGLYAERVGGLTIVADRPEIGQAIYSQFKSHARAVYSNPPHHGARIVAKVLGESELRKSWQVEVAQMRERIASMRKLFSKQLDDSITDHDFSFLRNQNGMFSYSGLSAQQVDRLIEQHGIYLLRSGRINVAGISEKNVDRVCDCIHTVMRETVHS